eukprot:2980078-Rhodomonas_salina.1
MVFATSVLEGGDERADRGERGAERAEVRARNQLRKPPGAVHFVPGARVLAFDLHLSCICLAPYGLRVAYGYVLRIPYAMPVLRAGSHAMFPVLVATALRRHAVSLQKAMREMAAAVNVA